MVELKMLEWVFQKDAQFSHDILHCTDILGSADFQEAMGRKDSLQTLQARLQGLFTSIIL